MPRRPKRKRKRAAGLWYLVQDGDILETSSTKSDLLSLRSTYSSLNIDCRVISKREYEKTEKTLNQERRKEVVERNKLIAEQDSRLCDALVIDNKRKRSIEEEPKQDVKRPRELPKESNRTKMLEPKESKRTKILESYKRLYPTHYTWKTS